MVFRITPFEEPDIISRRLLHISYALYGPAGCGPRVPQQQSRGPGTASRGGRGAGSVVALDIGEKPPGRDTSVGYHRDLRRLASLRALLDLVIDRLADRFPCCRREPFCDRSITQQ